MATTPAATGGKGGKMLAGFGTVAGALIGYAIYASVTDGGEQVRPDRSPTEASRSIERTGEATSGPAPQQHETTPVRELVAPPNGTTRVVVEANGRYMCVRDMRGINRLYQNRQHEWVAQRPADGVRAWSYQSETAEPRIYRYRLDTDPDCKTNPPIS